MLICDLMIYVLNKRYFIGSRVNLNYTEAINVCLNDGGVLATINNENDQINAANVCGNIVDCWIGLNSMNNGNVWEWVDGTSVNGAYGFDINGNPTIGTAPWHTGQPDNALNDEYCVHLIAAPEYNHEWNDRFCWNGYLRALCMRKQATCVNINICILLDIFIY